MTNICLIGWKNDKNWNYVEFQLKRNQHDNHLYELKIEWKSIKDSKKNKIEGKNVLHVLKIKQLIKRKNIQLIKWYTTLLLLRIKV